MNTEISSKQNPSQNPVLKDIVWIAIIAIIYLIVGNLSLKLIFKPEGIGAVWPNSGIFLCAILLTRRKLWPFLIGTLFVTDYIIEMIAGSPLNVSLVYAFALTFDATLSAWLIIRFVGMPVNFCKVKHVFGFITLSVVFSNALAATIASLAPHFFLGEPFWNSWTLWWSSDAVGNLLISPLILSWVLMPIPTLQELNKKRLAEAVVFFIFILVVNYVAMQNLAGNFNLFYILNYFTFPFLIWAAIRFGVRGVTLASVTLTANIFYFTLSGQIMFFNIGSVLHSVILVQLYIAIISVSSLILASVYTERRQIEEALNEKKKFIESIVNLSSDILYIYDIKEQKNIYSNDGIQTVLGYSVAEVREMGSLLLPRLMHPDDFKTYLEETYPKYSKLKDNETIIHQYRMKHRKGEWYWLDCSEIIYLRESDGSPRQIFGVVHDITHLKQTEAELNEKAASLNTELEVRRKAEEELKKYQENLEELVKQRTAQLNIKNEELETFNKLFVGRELRMIELKKKIAELEKETDGMKKIDQSKNNGRGT